PPPPPPLLVSGDGNGGAEAVRLRIREAVTIDGLVWQPGDYELEEGYWLLRLLASGACERIAEGDDEEDDERAGKKRGRKERE
ncbi:MAG: hypothetical protein NZ761_07450, partial [Dehalococcoidia bacterium]|nr:hypothetical protein [Dehalococcoidia bacterium]